MESLFINIPSPFPLSFFSPQEVNKFKLDHSSQWLVPASPPQGGNALTIFCWIIASYLIDLILFKLVTINKKHFLLQYKSIYCQQL